MIITLLSWCFIFGCSIVLGNVFTKKIMPETFQNTTKIDVYFVSGLMILNVYAQICSIFIKVGKMAFLIMTVIVLAMLVWCLVEYKIRGSQLNLVNIKKVETWKICITIMIGGATLLFTIKSPEFVDTYLYHIQAIRWIEEYGVVPGLGNLHNRFAYNSAFLPLQALFSFSWTTEPLHSLNGLLGCFFAVYAIVTNNIFSSEKNTLSDYLKLVIIPYIFLNHRNISSPGTDMLAMLLVLYITIKWSECIDKQETIQSYALLCFIGVWAASVKLSTAISVLLVIYPAIHLLKKKAWRVIIKDLVCGIIIILPWFIRNVIISGYLIYPYSGIDIFTVDWKMPAALLDYDKMEIAVYGREARDVSRYYDSISVWFPTWFENQMLRNKLLIFAGLMAFVCMVLLMVFIVINSIHRKKMSEFICSEGNRFLLLGTVLLGEAFWILTAPLVRYGMVYLMMPMAVSYFLLEKLIGPQFNRFILVLGTCVWVLLFLYRSDDFRLIQPQGYWKMDSVPTNLQGITIYSAADGGTLSGYADFPAVANKRVLDEIELRGEDLSSGFRLKK